MGVWAGKGVVWGGVRLVLVLVMAATLCGAIVAQEAAPVGMDATALVRRAVQHTLEGEKSHRPMEYLLRKRDDRHDTTKEIVETKDGDVARLVAVDGKQLSADVERWELARLDNLKAHPELQEKRRKSEEKDAARVDRLMGMLPDAFLYRVEGVESCTAGRCYRLSFAPNAKWEPPDLEAEFLRGIAGEVWISLADERLTRLDARFVADADIGLGILGKVNKGGTVRLEQTDIGGNDWELTRMTVHLTGKVLLVKSWNVQMVQEASDFSPVAPGMGYAAAVEMLKQLQPGTPPGEK